MIDILGAGRIGRALQARAARAGLSAACIGRRDEANVLANTPGRPLLIATRNDDLDAALARVPTNRLDDLVFVQNGMIRPFLTERGHAAATRALLYFAVPALGDDAEGGLPSPVYGPHAASLVDFGAATDLGFVSVDAEIFADRELEKLLWLVIFGTIGGVTGEPVGRIAQRHEDDIAALVEELAPVARTAIPARASAAAITEGLLAYTRTVPLWRAAPREHSWRAGWCVERASDLGLRTPNFNRWLSLLAS